MVNEESGDAWADLSADVAKGLRAWRQEHPRATLDEIAESVEGGLGRLRGRFVEDLATEGETTEAAVWPVCAQCGGKLEHRGKRMREVLIPRQTTPLRLRRTYGVCSACGSGFFPPR
ncbi:MAG TPA: hypothetical protein VNF74_01770 [Terriglobales bacterium]|nr:hypothetical protein [Terriglobales bacterium]